MMYEIVSCEITFCAANPILQHYQQSLRLETCM